MQCSSEPRGPPILIVQWSSPRLSNWCAEMSWFSEERIGKRDSTALP